MAQKDVTQVLSDLTLTPTEVLRFIACHIKMKCELTYIHSINVSRYAARLAAIVLPNQVHTVRIAGLLHDVGKIMISNTILQKKGHLTEEEFGEIKRHCIYGDEYLKANWIFSQYANVVRHHHEHWDGTGYPDALAGKNIPIQSRIICLADAFDAMIGLRKYKKALSAPEALNEIKRNAGSQFDPHLSHIFISCMENGIEVEGFVSSIRLFQ